MLVLSNDTDVAVTLLYHLPSFFDAGLEELWMKAGVGDSTRFVPLHTLYTRHDKELLRALPAIHSLTGCDVTSKIGTKKAALRAPAVQQLAGFTTNDNLTNDTIQKAEHYLIKVLNPKSEASTFTEYRKEVYHHKKSAPSMSDLPPTSLGVRAHISRAYYAAKLVTSALDYPPPVLDPRDYGFVENEDILVPTQVWGSLPSSWTVVCTCGKCARATCLCKKEGVQCVEFCNCQKTPSQCKNTDKNHA